MHRNCTKHQVMVWNIIYLNFSCYFLRYSVDFWQKTTEKHLWNKEKAHHYIQNMVADLKADTADLNFSILLSAVMVRSSGQCFASTNWSSAKHKFSRHFLLSFPALLLLDATLYPKPIILSHNWRQEDLILSETRK